MEVVCDLDNHEGERPLWGGTLNERSDDVVRESKQMLTPRYQTNVETYVAPWCTLVNTYV